MLNTAMASDEVRAGAAKPRLVSVGVQQPATWSVLALRTVRSPDIQAGEPPGTGCVCLPLPAAAAARLPAMIPCPASCCPSGFVQQPLPDPTSGIFLEVSFRRLLASCEDIVAGTSTARPDLAGTWRRSPVFHHVRPAGPCSLLPAPRVLA